MPAPKNKAAQDYRASILVHKPVKDVFKAINDVRGWWIGDIDGESNKVGDEFVYSYKEFHNTTQKVIEMIPNKKIVWEVTKSKINFVKDKNEWKDTQIIFELTPEGEGTRVTLTHVGLTPKIECYDGCSGGWDFYLKKSLQSFILTGKGVGPNF